MFPSMNRNVPDIEDKIISYLEHKDLIASKLVNREWNQAIARREGNNVLFPKLGKSLPRVEERILSFLDPKDLAVLKLVSMKWYVASQTMMRHEYDPLYKAVLKNYEHISAFILKDQDQSVNLRFNRGQVWSWSWKPLITATLRGRDEIVHQLLKRPDIDVNATDLDGESALTLAAARGKERIVQLLLERPEVHVNHYFKFLRDSSFKKHDYTALIAAAFRGHDNMVKLLLGRHDVDVNAEDSSGNTALATAILCGHDFIVRMLLERDDIEVNSIDVQGRTPLILATLFERVLLVKTLLKKMGIKTDVQDIYGETALSVITRRWYFSEEEKEIKQEIVDALKKKKEMEK